MVNDNSVGADVSQLETDITQVETLVQKGISLDGVSSANVRKTLSSGSFTEIFNSVGPGFATVQLLTSSLSGATAEVRMFDGSITDINKIGHGKAGANSKACATCGLTPYLSTLRVDGKSDGFNDVEILISTIASGEGGTIAQRTDTDTTIKKANPTTNYQNSIIDFISVDGGGALDESALLKFDVSSIPVGRTVSSATITFYNFGGSADVGDFGSAHAVLQEWTVGEATWNERKSGVSWNTPGMDSGTDFRSTAEAQFDLSSVVSATLTIDVTSLVQEWVNRSLENYGICMRSVGLWGGLEQYQWKSSNADAGADAPLLDVVYT